MDDLIEGFVRLMHMPEDLTGPVNLGNPGEFTMIELAEKVKAITGSKQGRCSTTAPTATLQMRGSSSGPLASATR